jgi:phosphoenolpyruvate synthase/pyruvate phosphate dikinase
VKRKSTPKKRPAWRPPLEEEEERLIAQLMEEMRRRAPADIVERVPNSLFAQRLIELLPSEEYAIPLLLALKERFHEKNVNRAIRRSVFKLERKGISTDATLLQRSLAFYNAAVEERVRKHAPGKIDAGFPIILP